MQLTPRGLVLTGSAMLAGGLALGVITTLAPSPASTSTSPSPSPSLSPSWSDADLGDQVISYPAGPPAPTGAPPVAMSAAAPEPSAATSTPSPVPSQPTAPATAGSPAPAPAGTSPSPAPRPASRPSPRPTAHATTPPAPMATRPPSPRPSSRPSSRPPRETERPVVVRGGWSAPSLRVGANDLAAPALSSGARVQVTVACSPSRACVVSGSDLLVDPVASSVTVTWSAPARAGYRAWRVSRAL